METAEKKGQNARARQLTAYHEAGHVVVNHKLMFPAYSVTIVPRKGVNGECMGECNPYRFETSTRRERKSLARDSIIGFYAGDEAEKLLDQSHVPTGGGNDDANAFWMSREFGVHPRRCNLGDKAHLGYLDRLRREARSILQGNWGLVTTIANALLEKGTLNAAEVDRLLATPAGTAVAAGTQSQTVDSE